MAAGRPVFLLTAPGRRPPAGLVDVGPPLPLDLMHVALRRVTAVAPAGVDLDAGAAESADGRRPDDHPRPRHAPAVRRRLGYLPRVQQEWLSYDGDADRVAYDVTGLVPGGAYDLGFVTWDPDGRGRTASAVGSADRRRYRGRSTGWGGCRPPPWHRTPGGVGVAPTDVTVALPPTAAGRARVTFDRCGPGGVAVCEVWVGRATAAGTADGR